MVFLWQRTHLLIECYQFNFANCFFFTRKFVAMERTHKTQNTKHQTPNSIVLFFDFFESFLYFVLVESRFSPDEHHDVLGSPEDRPRLPQPPLPAGVSLFSHDESPLGAPLYRARWMAPNQPRVELPKDDDQERARARNIFNTKMEQGKKIIPKKEGKVDTPLWFHLSMLTRMSFRPLFSF